MHNETCGCAECGNYGQRYNPKAIHNQSCGCSECGNSVYVPTNLTQSEANLPIPCVTADPDPAPGSARAKKGGKVRAPKAVKMVAPTVETIAVPVELVAEVRALIAARRIAESGDTADGGA